MRRHPNVVNLSELEPAEGRCKGRFHYRDRWLSYKTGGKGIGCSWYEVEPGKAAFPHHYHCANEEAYFILEGRGTLRLGAERIEVGPGDYVTCLVGPEHPHQLLNTGDSPLRYLCLSTLHPVEVFGQPDSDKIGASMWTPDGESPVLRFLARKDSAVDDFEGEDLG